jgi:peptide chain release factor 2
MSALNKQLVDLKSRANTAREALDIETMKKRIAMLDAEMQLPDFWSDQENARTVSQEAADLKEEVGNWDGIASEIDELISVLELAESENDTSMIEELAKQSADLTARFEKLEFTMLFSGKYDANNAILSLHAGAGGTDAQDWTEMLFRMYARFAEKKGWKMEVINESRGEEAGIKHVTFGLAGRSVYGHMRGEAGVHRIVRISPFDAEKMRHTAFALLEVVPELDKVSEKEFDINMDDVRIDTFMSSGKGGQSVNTTYSAVRVTHTPTSTVVSCQNERSQLQNKETALRVLKSKLFQRMLEERAEKLDELKGGHKSPEWGNQIRSYVLHPYKMVKDHRSNYEVQDVERVLNGDLDDFVEENLRFIAREGDRS